MSTIDSIEHVIEMDTNCEMKAEDNVGSSNSNYVTSIETIELTDPKTYSNSPSKKLDDIQIEIETQNDNGAKDKIEIVIENSKTATAEDCESSKSTMKNIDNAEMSEVTIGDNNCVGREPIDNPSENENSAPMRQQSQECDELKRTNSVHFEEKPFSNGTGMITEDIGEASSTKACSRLSGVDSTSKADTVPRNTNRHEQIRWNGQKSCCFVFFIILFIIWIVGYWAYMNDYLQKIFD